MRVSQWTRAKPLRMTAIHGSWWRCPSSVHHLAEWSQDRHAVMRLTDGREMVTSDLMLYAVISAVVLCRPFKLHTS
jgi:hypothetical protein